MTVSLISFLLEFCIFADIQTVKKDERIHITIYMHKQKEEKQSEIIDFNCSLCGHINTTGSSKIFKYKFKLTIILKPKECVIIILSYNSDSMCSIH